MNNDASIYDVDPRFNHGRYAVGSVGSMPKTKSMRTQDQVQVNAKHEKIAPKQEQPAARQKNDLYDKIEAAYSKNEKATAGLSLGSLGEGAN